MNVSKRYDWVDWLKAFGIVLVMLGHLQLPGWFRSWIYSFHMPLFFMVSGFLLGNSGLEVSWGEFWRKRIKKLTTFYFTFAIFGAAVSIVLQALVGGWHVLPRAAFERFLSVLYASGTVAGSLRVYPIVLWFFSALIMGFIISWALGKCATTRYRLIIAAALAWLSVTFLQVSMVWEIESGVVASFYVCVGLELRRNEQLRILICRSSLSVLLLCLMSGAVFACYASGIDYRSSNIESPLLATASCLLTLGSLVGLMSKFQPVSFVRLIANASILIFPVHCIVYQMVDIIFLGKKDFSGAELLAYELVKGGVTFILLLCAWYIFESYMRVRVSRVSALQS